MSGKDQLPIKSSTDSTAQTQNKTEFLHLFPVFVTDVKVHSAAKHIFSCLRPHLHNYWENISVDFGACGKDVLSLRVL